MDTQPEQRRQTVNLRDMIMNLQATIFTLALKCNFFNIRKWSVLAIKMFINLNIPKYNCQSLSGKISYRSPE